MAEVARVYLTLAHAKRLVIAMARSLKAHEELFGEINADPYIPMLIGSDNEAVPLYHFVEVMDEIVDYDLVRQELPTLSYAQIGGAISFLRKVSQINPQGADLDILEDMELSEDPAFLDELREALADEETSRVFNRD